MGIGIDVGNLKIIRASGHALRLNLFEDNAAIVDAKK